MKSIYCSDSSEQNLNLTYSTRQPPHPMLMNIRQCRSSYLLGPSISNLLSVRLRTTTTTTSFPPSSLSSYPLFSSHSPPPPPPQVIFSGIQPTGVPHIGNYLGALQEWVRLQNEAPARSQLFFSIVDLHALTNNAPAAGLKQWKRQTLATLLAVGLDPKRSTIFYQSSVGLTVHMVRADKEHELN